MKLRHLLSGLAISLILPLSAAQADSSAAIQVLQSSQTVDATVEQLREAFTSRGMTIFAVIDHQAAAKESGLTMQAAKVIIYGTPKADTPLMLKDPHFALQLPLKVLVTESKAGKTEVVFETTKTLLENSGISLDEVEQTLAKAEGLIKNTIN